MFSPNAMFDRRAPRGPRLEALALRRGEVRVQGRTCNPNPEIWEFEILAPSKFRDVEIPRFQQMSEIWEM